MSVFCKFKANSSACFSKFPPPIVPLNLFLELKIILEFISQGAEPFIFKTLIKINDFIKAPLMQKILSQM